MYLDYFLCRGEHRNVYPHFTLSYLDPTFIFYEFTPEATDLAFRKLSRVYIREINANIVSVLLGLVVREKTHN